ncbi:MAG TPA: PAS domain S-box protein [Nitrospira sp.]|nr:PAS domain S-box protein [Nitrospira sp.]
MEITTGLLAGALALLGTALWRLHRQRHDCLLKSRIITATGCSIVVTDATVPRHPVIYVNPAFRLLTGYTDDEIFGQSLTLLHGPQTDRSVTEKLAMAIQDGRAFRTTACHYRKDGSPFWNELTLAPMKNRAGRVTEYIWVMSDVTLRHQAEEALKVARDLAPLSDLLSDGILVARDSALVYVNPAALTVLAIATPEEAVGKPIQSFFDTDISDVVRQSMENHRSGTSVSRKAARLLRQDGRALEIDLSVVPVVWEGKASSLLLISPTASCTQAEEAGGARPAAMASLPQAVVYFGSWDRDVRTGIEIWSDEQCRIFGYEPGMILPTYDMFKAALHEEDRGRVLAAVERSLQEDAPFDVECRIVQPCGAVRFVRCRGMVIRNVAGEPIRMSGTVEDLTSCKLIEEVAKERDLEFRVVVESVPGGIVILGQNGTISLVNARIEQMFGYSREELLGRSVELLLPEHWRQEEAGRRDDESPSLPGLLIAGGVKDLLGRRKDGARFPIEIGVTPLELASGRSTFVTIVDITDRRRVEEDARQSHLRFDLAVQAAHVGIFEHDHTTDRLYWSPTLRQIFGVSQDETGSVQRYVDFIPREERERILHAIREAHDPLGDGRFQAVHRLIRPDGTVRHVCVRSLTSFEGEGTGRAPVRTVGAVVDITDHEHAVEHLRDASKMEAIGTLAGGIAHELNNRLTAVLGFSELALPLVPSDSKARRHIQQVVTAGRKSRELVHQLLTFSRQSDQVRRPLSLHLLVKESLKLLRPTIPSWIELRERIAGSTRPISADMTQMHQMILNLVENALHAMSRTGGVLDIQLQDKEFAADQVTPFGTMPAGCYACLTVRDSGEGMDPELASRLFDPFFTAKPSRKGREMGLAVVHEIVTAQGGTVLVESDIGIGTAVSVYLPALPPRASSASIRDEPLPRGHECVLFVDDEESLARFGGEMLESLGYFAVVRRTAAEALEAFRIAPQRFNLLITDQTMPGMNGDLLARECRKLRPDLPIILCTGSDQALSGDEARACGVTDFALKPLTLHDLAHMIRRVLDLPVPPPPPNPIPPSRLSESSTLLIEESDAIGTRH